MPANNITCAYLDCDNPRPSSWGWITASNGLDELPFCSQQHHDIWMEKNAGNFWDIRGLGSDNVKYGPRTIKQEDNGKLEFNCRLSPHITEENKQAIIQSVMTQLQGYDVNPTIVAPQNSFNFVVTVDKGNLSTHEVKDKLSQNYFVDHVSTRSDAKLVKNLHINLNKQASTNDLTNKIISLTRQNSQFQGDYADQKIQWVPTDIVHGMREFDRGDKDGDSFSRQTIDDIKDSLPKTGFQNPLIVNYSKKDRHAYLCEGNHRLIAAQELGLTHVPVRVIKKDNSGNKGRGNAKQVPGVDPDIHDYVMGDMSPSQIGMVDEKNIIKNSSVGGQGYDAPVTSYLDAPGAQDPEGPQYIIDQANITGPQIEASKAQEDPEFHKAIAAYLKVRYNWDENDRFGQQYSDYSSADERKNLSLMHGFTSDAWGDVCTCPMCSFANKVPSGPCSGVDCDKVYNKEAGDRLFLIRPGTNIIKKNVWKYNPDDNTYLCPDCKSLKKTSSKSLKAWYE